MGKRRIQGEIACLSWQKAISLMPSTGTSGRSSTRKTQTDRTTRCCSEVSQKDQTARRERRCERHSRSLRRTSPSTLIPTNLTSARRKTFSIRIPLSLGPNPDGQSSFRKSESLLQTRQSPLAKSRIHIGTGVLTNCRSIDPCARTKLKVTPTSRVSQSPKPEASPPRNTRLPLVSALCVGVRGSQSGARINASAQPKIH
jgi:hypothetical protein